MSFKLGKSLPERGYFLLQQINPVTGACTDSMLLTESELKDLSKTLKEAGFK
jgi:hypothetical protein